MEVRVSDIGDIAIVHLKGKVFTENAAILLKTLQEIMDRDIIKIIVSLKETEIISSSGLGVILSTMVSLRKKGGDIVLSSPRDIVEQTMKVTNFHQIMSIYPSDEEAIKAFQLGKTHK